MQNYRYRWGKFRRYNGIKNYKKSLALRNQCCYYRIMKTKWLSALVLSFISTVANAATATDTEFKTKAKSAFLMDYDSGVEIVSKNADLLMPPSSMVKLMTLAVLFDEIKAGNLTLDSKLPVS